MGHSLTSFKGKSIQSKDYKVQVWLFLIVREIDKISNLPEWLKAARDDWRREAETAVNGCMSPQFDKHLDTDEKVEFIKNVYRTVMDDLRSFGEMIPKEFINDLCGNKPPNHVREDNEAELYLGYGDAVVKLLDGRQTERLINA